MSLAELLVLAVGLSMDACAVAICKGACMRARDLKKSAAIALSFGFFQAVMPLLGWLLGTQMHRYIKSFDHWVVFVLLAFLGGKMIRDALHEDEKLVCTPLHAGELLLLSVATSIDALAAGIALSLLEANIVVMVLSIGAVTALLSFAGVALGVRYGQKYQAKAQVVGEAVLCVIGLRILVQHLGAAG